MNGRLIKMRIPREIFFLALASVIAIVAGGCNSRSQEGQPAPSTSIKDVMDAIVDPSADVLWGAVGSIVDKTGDHQLAPKTPAEWADVRRAAIRVVEGAS